MATLLGEIPSQPYYKAVQAITGNRLRFILTFKLGDQKLQHDAALLLGASWLAVMLDTRLRHPSKMTASRAPADIAWSRDAGMSMGLRSLHCEQGAHL